MMLHRVHKLKDHRICKYIFVDSIEDDGVCHKGIWFLGNSVLTVAMHHQSRYSTSLQCEGCLLITKQKGKTHASR
jgi:hypothetical protein